MNRWNENEVVVPDTLPPLKKPEAPPARGGQPPPFPTEGRTR